MDSKNNNAYNTGANAYHTDTHAGGPSGNQRGLGGNGPSGNGPSGNGQTRRRKGMGWLSIIGGDILATDFFRRQTKLLVLVLVLVLFYIHNRYAAQRQMIEIARLKDQLTDVRYMSLVRSAELMKLSRQSMIEERIADHDGDLHVPAHPPYLIK